MAKAKQQADENVPNFALDLSQMKVLTDAPRREPDDGDDEPDADTEAPSQEVFAGPTALTPPSCLRPLTPDMLPDGSPLPQHPLEDLSGTVHVVPPPPAAPTPPAQVDLEEAGFAAVLAQERVVSKALAFENAQLTAELSRVRCESAVIVAGSELQKAQNTYTAAKKSAEDKLGISWDDYNYEPVGAVLRLKSQS